MLSILRTWPGTIPILQHVSRRFTVARILKVGADEGRVIRYSFPAPPSVPVSNITSSLIPHQAHIGSLIHSRYGEILSSKYNLNWLEREWTFRRRYSDFRRPPDLKDGKTGHGTSGDLENLFRFLVKQDPRILLVGVVSIVGGLFYVTHLERVPETGRWRFIAVSDRWEVKLAKEQHKAFLDGFGSKLLPASHPITQIVASTVNSVLQANKLGYITNIVSPSFSNKDNVGDEDIWDSDMQRFEEASVRSDVASLSLDGRDAGREWNLFVVNDISTMNAAASFNNIIIWTGIFLVANTTDSIAAVISHEIAHSVARHNAEKMSLDFIVSALLILLFTLGIDTGFNDTLANLLLKLPNSRTMELEADKIGLGLAAKACFDPKGAVILQTMMMMLDNVKGGLPKMDLSFLQTHPSGELRIKRIRDELPAAYAMRAKSSACVGIEQEFKAFQDRAASFDEPIDYGPMS